MDNWIIYEHISPSGKVYIGITSQNVERRWKNGMGMEKDLIKFYTDGGDGAVGIKYDDKHNQNVSRVMKLYYKSHDHPLTGFRRLKDGLPFKGKLIKYESEYLNSTSNQTIYNKEDR